MESTLRWEPPTPGPWQQDSAHNPVAQTAMLQHAYPAGFNRGFEECFDIYGVLLDRLAMASINGFTYHQPQPFDLPGPDGPKDPEWIGAEISRRTGVAAEAFEARIWREGMRRWDEELKPASIARAPFPRRGPLGVGRGAAAGPHRRVHRACERHGVPAPPSQHARDGARRRLLAARGGLDRATADDLPVGVRRLLAGLERGGPGDGACARRDPAGRRSPRPSPVARRGRGRAGPAP